MLKKHARFFKSLYIMSDLFILTCAWVLSYLMRFDSNLIKPSLSGVPSLGLYIQFLLPLWAIWGFASHWLKLYRPRRMEHFAKEFFDITKTLVFTFFIMITLIYLFKRFEFSRLAFFYFLMMAVAGLLVARFFTRRIMALLRKRGFNRRFALIAGTGRLGQKVLDEIRFYPELGIRVLGFLTGNSGEIGRRIKNISVIGLYKDIARLLRRMDVDIFFIALSISEYRSFENLVKNIRGDLSEIKVVPASYELLGLRGGMDALGDLPIMSLQEAPLYGWNSVLKRIFDLILGTIILLATSPIMLTISLLIKWTSKGPILYRQERIGMDGRHFQMLKFRTMTVDAEKETGPIWAKKDDPRRTRVGAFLRKNSLDELPQVFNVLKGEMSLVGPRPERPDFVKEFKDRIPLYMLRHTTKTGMTGWAQVNGWRGNTSLEKRIEHDLYYIQHWSIGFDLKILLMTLWRGLLSKSAY
jgi:Undecaprenyl-phosphate glucose phosphotransferase